MNALQTEVGYYIREICRIAYLCNDKDCLLNISTIVGFVGNYVQVWADQNKLLDLLRGADSDDELAEACGLQSIAEGLARYLMNI